MQSLVGRHADGGPSRQFILRPVATTLVMMAILLAGILGYRFLPVATLPEVDYPTIQVVTLYPGANPDVVSSFITAPLENQFGQMPGLKQLSSQSSEGASVIILQFQLSLSLDIAEQSVQAAINAASNLLPTDLPYPPIYNKVNPADPPILILAATSTQLPMPQVENLLETRLVPKIAQIPGVGMVTLAGGQRPAFRVKFNAGALAHYGLSAESVRSAIVGANVNTPKGSLDGVSQAITLSSNDQMKDLADYQHLIIAYHHGAAIRLQDVATVYQGAENQKLAGWANRDPAIIVNIQRQPGGNVVTTSDKIRALLPTLKQQLPSTISINVLADRTDTVRASIGDIQFELVLAVILVILVISLFLHNMTTTLIPAVTIPLSLAGTFAVIYLLGFSINNLTLMALTIATGFVVDDAIVVIENIIRYLEQGTKPLQAALYGAGEIGFTIISLTLSLVAVLIPLLFSGDIVGRLFREFAVTLAVAILLSAFISLTLTPMMCARLLKQAAPQPQERLSKESRRFFDWLLSQYGRGLRPVLNHPWLTLSVTLGSLLLTLLLYLLIPKGFFPNQDINLLQGVLEAPPSVSFSEMSRRQQQVVDRLLRNPYVQNITSLIGVNGSNGTLNRGRLQIMLKPLSERHQRLTQIIRQLTQQTDNIAGVRLYLQPARDLTIETLPGQAQYQFTIQSLTPEELHSWIPRFTSQLRQLPQLRDLSSDWQNNGLAAFINIDRDSASRLGISMADINTALYNAFGQRQISTIYTQSNQYRVVLEQDAQGQHGLDLLNNLYLTTSDNRQVPLRTFSKIEQRFTPLSINRLNQLSAVTFSFNLSEGYSLGQAIQAMTTLQQQCHLPADMNSQLQGSTLAFVNSLAHTPLLILAAVIVMYIVLGILYESFIHPVTILSTLPTAALGALIALLLAGKELDIIAVLGIILLIGIVKKNGIMMVDFALTAEQQQGLTPEEAIYQACLLRFRPIIMTTMAALLAALPLMFSIGVGAELRQPLGICIVGGLVVSQLLTLFTTPVIYLLFARLRHDPLADRRRTGAS